jgi:ligand-binding sensor domain-containing protein/two-component sensor histidine kinase
MVCKVFAGPQDYTFRQIKVEDGLSQSTVLTSLQDSRGFMWFGTIDGLNRYDGYNFTVYVNDPSDSTSISDNLIKCLYEDSKKQLWIGTTNGYINKFDMNTETFKHYSVDSFLESKIELPGSYYDYPLVYSRNNNISVTSITEDKYGYLWFSTWGNGVIRFDPKSETAKHFYHSAKNENSLSNNRATKILIDNDGTIWIGTFGGGLNKLVIDSTAGVNQFTFTHYIKTQSGLEDFGDNRIISLYEDYDKNIWVGTYSGGLSRIDYDQKLLSHNDIKIVRYVKEKNNSNSLGYNTVTDVVQDNSGYLWVGTFGAGLNRLNIKTGNFIHFSNDPSDPFSFPENDILSLTIDRSGILWVGSHVGGGVTLVTENRTKFSILKKIPGNPNSLNDGIVWSVYEDSNNMLWIGTYRGGINVLNEKTRKFIVIENDPRNLNSLSNNHVRTIQKDHFGNFWIGTYSGGINKYNPKTGNFTRFIQNEKDSNSISGNQIQDIFIESDSVIWVGTFGGGLDKLTFEKNSSVSYPKITVYRNNPSDPNSLSDDRVYIIYEDRDNNFWIGTAGGGLCLFDKRTGIFNSYKNDPNDPYSISSDRIMSILEDSNGRLWIGTSGGGLNKFNKKTKQFTRFTQKNGLSSAVVYGILEDNAKNLWMSTDNGIFKFNLANESFAHFDMEDGLQSLEFNGGSYFKASDGKMFFGGINGLNYFYPDSIRTNLFVPPVVITSINVLTTKIKGDVDEIILSHDQNFISFEFAALDYSNPTENQYAFMLEGLDDEWKYVDAERRIANYINLPAGEYYFHIRGSNSDGLWNKSGTTVKLIITPPYWKTWWFITLMIIIAAIAVYYLSTVKIKQQLAIEKLKTKLAADLHDNVGSSLTEISILSEVAAQKNNGHNDSRELKNISETARQLIDTMSDIVFVVNPERDSLHDLIIKIKDSYYDFLNSVGISFRVKNIDKVDDIKLSMDYKQNLLLIFKEGINNAVKHSKCKRIMLKAKAKGDAVEMSLTDDGIGFDEKNISFGNGISNIESRANKIGGKITFRSAQGNGTTIKFVGKISRFNKIKSFLNI